MPTEDGEASSFSHLTFLVSEDQRIRVSHQVNHNVSSSSLWVKDVVARLFPRHHISKIELLLVSSFVGRQLSNNKRLLVILYFVQMVYQVQWSIIDAVEYFLCMVKRSLEILDMTLSIQLHIPQHGVAIIVSSRFAEPMVQHSVKHRCWILTFLIGKSFNVYFQIIQRLTHDGISKD